MKTKITKKLCRNCKYVDFIQDNYGDITHMCNLFFIPVENIHKETCSHHILDTENFCLSNERETVRKHECKKKHEVKSKHRKNNNPYDLNKAPGFNKNG